MDEILHVDTWSLVARLGIDLVAIAILTGLLSYPRHHRHDLVVLCGVFNIGLFAAVVVIAQGDVTVAVGFGLFAVLSIIRLRSETLSNGEIAYFFAAIVLGLVAGVDLDSLLLTALLAVLVVSAAAVFDHGRVAPGSRALRVTLGEAIAGQGELREAVERRLGMAVTDLELREIDYVREITSVDVRVPCRAAPPEHPPERSRLAPG